MGNVKAELEVVKRGIEVSEDLFFVPSAEMRKAKAAYWAKIEDSGLPSPPPTLPHAVKISGVRALNKWWSMPLFQEWFGNRDEYRQRIEFLVDLALDKAQAILMSDDPKTATASVSLIKILIEASNKMPQRYDRIKYADEAIQKMDKAELENFVAKNAHLISASEAPSDSEAAAETESKA